MRKMTWVHTGNVSEVNTFADCLSSSEWEEVLKMVGQIKMSMPAGWREGSVAKRTYGSSSRGPELQSLTPTPAAHNHL